MSLVFNTRNNNIVLTPSQKSRLCSPKAIQQSPLQPTNFYKEPFVKSQKPFYENVEPPPTKTKEIIEETSSSSEADVDENISEAEDDIANIIDKTIIENREVNIYHIDKDKPFSAKEYYRNRYRNDPEYREKRKASQRTFYNKNHKLVNNPKIAELNRIERYLKLMELAKSNLREIYAKNEYNHYGIDENISEAEKK